MRYRRRAMVAVLVLLVQLGPAASARVEYPDASLRASLVDAALSLEMALSETSLDGLSLLPARVARGLDDLVTNLSNCIEISTELQSRVNGEWSEILEGSRRHASAPWVAELQRCSWDLERSADRTSSTLEGERTELSIDLWPLLRLETSDGSDLYEHDYAILIDTGGNDIYLNNGGGNLLDLRRGPMGSAAPETAPARGCRSVGDVGNLTVPSVRTDPECVPAAAVLIDTDGNDAYGRMETPHPADDGICTNDPLVRRIMTGGAGFGGVGLLLDDDGNDVYLGKTGALGTGHVGGVGILRDTGGNDVYRAIRNSQGFGLVDGTGTLQDEAGNDLYDFYMPSPVDPGAEFQERGSGGVIDDTGLCDNLVRQLQGSAQLGGTGALVDGSGNDTYVAAEPALQDFHSRVVLAHGSQAFGSLGGYGILYDGEGHDSYLTESGTPMPERGDGMVQGPSMYDAGVLNSALFVDRT